MEGKLFLLDKGTQIAIRDADEVMVSFESIEQFKHFYSGDIDLTGHYYIDYEPERRLHYTSERGNFEPLENLWQEALPEYEAVIADVKNMREKLDDPYFDLDLEEARAFRTKQIKQLTYITITSHLPEWKQMKQREYIALYQKVEAGESLSDLQLSVYDRFPKEGETHDECYSDCLLAQQWIMECIAQNDKREKSIQRAKSNKGIKGVKDPDYPEWELKNV